MFTVSGHHETPLTPVAPRCANARSHQGLEWFTDGITGQIVSGRRAGA